MIYTPGDKVLWMRPNSKLPYQAQIIPAEVSHRSGVKIVIKVIDAAGEVALKWVPENQLKHEDRNRHE